jgi:hypothetical protein
VAVAVGIGMVALVTELMALLAVQAVAQVLHKMAQELAALQLLVKATLVEMVFQQLQVLLLAVAVVVRVLLVLMARLVLAALVVLEQTLILLGYRQQG